MNKERTLTNLLDLDKPVYLVFRNRTSFKKFIKQAQREGFEASSEMSYHSYIKMNNDMTFQTIVGMASHMKVYNDRESIYAVDYAKYVNGCNYFIAPKGHPSTWE